MRLYGKVKLRGGIFTVFRRKEKKRKDKNKEKKNCLMTVVMVIMIYVVVLNFHASLTFGWLDLCSSFCLRQCYSKIKSLIQELNVKLAELNV